MGSLGALPWEQPLQAWSPADVPLVEVDVGPSRHLVRFVAVAGGVWAIKELPRRLAVHEDSLLRRLMATDLPCVRPAGLVRLPAHDEALLVTRFLPDSWQLRGALPRLGPEHRPALLDLMLDLLVEAHALGLLWGDCSLANTLLRQDGGRLRAHLVDVETSELHHRLTPGQREQDVGIAVENAAGSLLDLSAAPGSDGESAEMLLQEAASLSERYDERWRARRPLAQRPSAGQDRAIRTDGATTRAAAALVAVGPDLAHPSARVR